jgi:hypothetical protein
MTSMQDTSGLARNSADLVLGAPISKAYTPLVVETKTLFTVTGLVLVTAIVGRVTTAITVANTVKLVANPTTGTASDLCAATDLGTTDTPAGNLLTITGAPAEVMITGIGAVPRFPVTEPQPTAVTTVQTGGAGGFYIDAGTIEQVTATGADGGITWFLRYCAIDPAARITAA